MGLFRKTGTMTERHAFLVMSFRQVRQSRQQGSRPTRHFMCTLRLLPQIQCVNPPCFSIFSTNTEEDYAWPCERIRAEGKDVEDLEWESNSAGKLKTLLAACDKLFAESVAVAA
jgi:hypothetical protein